MDEIEKKREEFLTKGLAKYLGEGNYLIGLKAALSSRLSTIQYEGLTEDQVASFVDIVDCLDALIDKIDEHNSKAKGLVSLDDFWEEQKQVINGEIISDSNGGKGEVDSNLMESVTTKHYSEMESNIKLLTPSVVKQMLKPTEDKLLQDAAEVTNKLIESNLRGLLFDGHIEVYFEEHSYPEQVINLLVEKLEQAGWDVELSEEADDFDVTSKYCLTLTMGEEE
ncbi:hypothetical protein LD13_gp215 [Bacillus phage Bobb]|uniref:Uncharacterized protein n=1 Tax=Bacillus phage Bobb TaxID=1527469 RepID=A0A076G821_9CAUD|nr:hypothetical protein LD13_gp215 [Bacillus phage Bobb]AII28134.1 hypothetical protein [Bacillus phage Bobb]